MKKPENLIKHWWWIVVCAIIFSSIGNLLTIVLPARYTQNADIQLLFEPTVEINWTDKSMLSVTEKVGQLVNDPDTQAAVLWEMRREGYPLNDKDFSRFTSKERRFYGWELTVTTKDPEMTETFLHIWKTTVLNAINHDLQMSQETQQHRKMASAWIPCLQQLPAEPIHPVCNPQNAAEMAANYNDVFAQYKAAKEQVKYLEGFPPTYSASPLRISSTERIPLISRSSTVFLGLMIGILIGVLTIETPWTHHLNFKRGES